MWVWQSQAPAGTSKFTGVEGCAAVAKADLSDMVIPAAMEASRILRRVSMAFLPVASLRPDFALARRVADYRVGARSSAVALAGISLGHRQGVDGWSRGAPHASARMEPWHRRCRTIRPRQNRPCAGSSRYGLRQGFPASATAARLVGRPSGQAEAIIDEGLLGPGDMRHQPVEHRNPAMTATTSRASKVLVD